MKNTIFVMFGATGDLMRKKVIPALYSLEKDKRLSSVQKIIGFSKREYSSEDFHSYMKEMVEHKIDTSPEILSSLFEKTSFISGYFNDSEAYKRLAEEINSFKGENTQIIFYLAVAPKFYEEIISSIPHCLGEVGRSEVSVVIEKPVGSNANEAIDIQNTLTREFEDSQIYRVDHYLHKSIVQAIFDFRFKNPFFESGWSNENITKIKIRTNESFGLEERGSFYDPLGALRDVGQNHLMMLLGVLLMNKPSEINPESIRRERSQILKHLKQIPQDKMAEYTYRAQYMGYREIENVHEQSITETYFKIKTEIDLARWRGVPIVLEAGKKLGIISKEIVVHLKGGSLIRFSFEGDDLGIFLTMQTSHGPQKEDILNITQEKRFVAEYMELIMSLVKGDKTWFVTHEEALSAWKFTDPISSAWYKGDVPLRFYAPNSLEPINESTILLESEIERFQIGVIGLGKMGMGIAKQLHEHGWDVVGNNRSNGKIDEFKEFGGKGAYTTSELIESFTGRRIIWVMVPSGEAIEHVLFNEDDGLIKLLRPGDIIIDGGNSNWEETKNRAMAFEERGIHFLDAGVSGGPEGARHGACIMIGGKQEVFAEVEQIFKDISLPGGYKFFRGHAAGHFVKMVHNGIEYGMMQALGEGFEVLKKSDYNLNLEHVAEVYNKGSVIESRLVDWLYKAFLEHGTELSRYSGKVGHLGEGKWTVETAKKFGIPVKVIEESFKFRENSADNPTYTGKIVSALREQFGGKRDVH